MKTAPAHDVYPKMIHAVREQQRLRAEKENGGNAGGAGTDGAGVPHQSPVKTVLGALTVNRRRFEVASKGRKALKDHKLREKPPKGIEDVPFRRQDRRVLNSRKKRLMDRKLIRCLVTSGIIVLAVGVTLVVLWWQMADGEDKFAVTRKFANYDCHLFFLLTEESLFEPFVLIGSVFIFFGVVIILFSVEICSRLRKNVARVKDPEIDRLKNIHHIKHWVDPGESPTML